jgi:5'-nucleotidase/UDP-sugar diphosphatase
VIAALENGVSQVEEGAGRFPQVSGMRFTWDPSAEPGSRIVSVEVGGRSPSTRRRPTAWCPTTSCAAAATGIPSSPTAMNAYDFGPGLEEVVATYVGENSPYTPYTDGRISEANKASDKTQRNQAGARCVPAFFVSHCCIAENANRLSQRGNCRLR